MPRRPGSLCEEQRTRQKIEQNMSPIKAQKFRRSLLLQTILHYTNVKFLNCGMLYIISRLVMLQVAALLVASPLLNSFNHLHLVWEFYVVINFIRAAVDVIFLILSH
jgi:hypothetical protein